MNLNGILLGLLTFCIIGAFHGIVIKAEYYFTKKCWPMFLLCGAVCCAASILMGSRFIPSAVFAIIGFSFFWGIKELFEQERRVAKGWQKSNPNRQSPELKEEPSLAGENTESA
jgi:hypothetical protein